MTIDNGRNLESFAQCGTTRESGEPPKCFFATRQICEFSQQNLGTVKKCRDLFKATDILCNTRADVAAEQERQKGSSELLIEAERNLTAAICISTSFQVQVQLKNCKKDLEPLKKKLYQFYSSAAGKTHQGIVVKGLSKFLSENSSPGDRGRIDELYSLSLEKRFEYSSSGDIKMKDYYGLASLQKSCDALNKGIWSKEFPTDPSKKSDI